VEKLWLEKVEFKEIVAKAWGAQCEGMSSLDTW
jgi:hypothetical protein